MKVAIIEDSAAMLRVWRKSLEGSTYAAEFFESSAESLSRLRATLPDAVFCSGLPGRQSVEVLKETLGPLLQTRPLILATSQDQERIKGAWGLEDVDGVLVKPFSRATLMTLLARLRAASLVRARVKPVAVVVDDSLLVTTVVKRVLERLGFEVQTASDGLTGLRLIQERLPDIAVVDVEMPGLSGWEVCEALSRDPATRDIPVVVSSATVDEKVERRGFLAGSLDVMPKPLSPTTLAETVARRLGQGSPRRRATALILDGDAIAATMTGRLMADLGVTTRVCSTIAELKAYLAIGQPGLLLLDADLPEGWGLELCRGLRRQRAYDAVPIVLMSTEGQRTKRLACLKAGADEFILKPFSRIEFRVRVESLVEGLRSTG